MKLYHFALFFALIACGSMVVIQVTMINERKQAEIRQTEKDCFISAADDMAEVLFVGNSEEVSLQKVSLAGDIFFQSLSLCRNGTSDVTTEAYWKQRVVLVVYEKNGYYRFSYEKEKDEYWEFFPYGATDPAESSMKIPSIVAILEADQYGKGKESNERICVASGRMETKYYVTEDGKYHVPECNKCKAEKVAFCYPTMKDCARAGAFPCEICLK